MASGTSNSVAAIKLVKISDHNDKEKLEKILDIYPMTVDPREGANESE